LQKSGKDLSNFEKELAKAVEGLINVMLKENFVGLESIIGEYSKP